MSDIKKGETETKKKEDNPSSKPGEKTDVKNKSDVSQPSSKEIKIPDYFIQSLGKKISELTPTELQARVTLLENSKLTSQQEYRKRKKEAYEPIKEKLDAIVKKSGIVKNGLKDDKGLNKQLETIFTDKPTKKLRKLFALLLNNYTCDALVENNSTEKKRKKEEVDDIGIKKKKKVDDSQTKVQMEEMVSKLVLNSIGGGKSGSNTSKTFETIRKNYHGLYSKNDELDTPLFGGSDEFY
jgi:hypothetical protein